jgi:hypothetical protein
MNFAAIRVGDSVFVDANIFVNNIGLDPNYQTVPSTPILPVQFPQTVLNNILQGIEVVFISSFPLRNCL